jgi:DNA-binding transcriptional LysR family regulator
MTLNQLQSFVTVAQYSSFTEASKRLHIVQSAVSHNVATLERELNIKLFIRKQNYVSLTKLGEILLEDAIKILNLTLVTERKLAIMSKELPNPLVIGFGFSFSLLPYKYKVNQFMREYADIPIRFKTFHIRNIKEELVDNVIDVALIHHIDVQDIKTIEWRALSREKYQLAVSEKHKIAHKECIHLSEASEEKWIFIGRIISPSHYDKCIKLCTNANFFPQILDEPESISTLLMMVSMDMGLSIVPASWANYYVADDLRYLDIDDSQAFRDQGLAWNKNNQNQSMKIFLDYIFK